MKNYKIEKGLLGVVNWPRISMVSAKGIPTAAKLVSTNTEDENEKIIQSWNNVLVMRATSDQPIEFFIGFYKNDKIVFLKHAFKTNLDFAMRLASYDVNFFVLPTDLASVIKLEIIEKTTVDDPKYSDLILL